MRDGWRIRKVKEICDKASSNIAQKEIVGLSGDYPVYGASGYVQNVDFFHRDKPYIGIVKDGSGVGRVNTYPAKTSLLGTLQYIIPKDGYLLGYVAYLLKSLNLAKFATGAAIPHIYFKEYGECKVPVPPIAEQEKIVAELDCLAGIIEKKKQQLEELDKLAQSIFYDMFGDIAHNSKLFPVEKICNLGELARGVSKHRPRNAPELLGGEMPLIQTGDVANADLFIREYHSTYSALGVSQSRVWEKGTICITIAANIGNCAILSFRACFPDSVVGFIHNDKLSLFYALFVFNNLQALLEDKARGIAQKNINLQILNELLIPVPSRDLQDLFAQKIEAIEKQKELVKRSIAETETLFNSRMDYWFN